MPARKLTALTAVAVALAPAAAQAAPGDTTLVSQTAGVPSSGHVYSPAISGDGSTVAFSTAATNLSSIDQDDTIDVFARALGPATTALVSAKPPAVVGPDVAGDSDSTSATISANGRYVAFRSPAINLSTEDQDNTDDIYRRDLQTGAIALVSRATGVAGAAADDDSSEPAISADGRLVAFASEAKNLSAGDDDSAKDIFVRDLQTHTTYWVSRLGGGAANDHSFRPQISADGSTVVFFSDATNLGAGMDFPMEADVFAHTLPTGTTELVSRQPASAGGVGQNLDAGTSNALAVNADGRRVAFTTKAANLTPDHGPSVDIVVRDRVADTVTLVSRANGPAGAAGGAASFQPSISGDGTRVAFHTYAQNLHPEDTDSAGDVYVRDLTTATTTLESRQSPSLGGAKGDDASFAASISSDGMKVAFSSYADNFADVAGYANSQAYVHELGGQSPPAGGTGGGGAAPAQPPLAPAPAAAAPAGSPASSAKKPAATLRSRLAFARGSSSCIRRGRLVLKLKVHRGPRGAKVLRANVKVGKSKTKRLKGKRARRVVLRGIRGRKAKVRITTRTTTGALLRRTRTYRTCTTRR